MSDKAKRVLVGLASVGTAIGVFLVADAAMPDEVKWWMRYWLAGVAFVCYLVGAAYAAYLVHGIKKEQIKELKAKVDALESEKRRKRETFDVLNERERWLLAIMLDVSPKVFSANGNQFIPVLDDMCGIGIINYSGEVFVNKVSRRAYSIAIDWRRWLAKHADELPDPRSDMPE